MIDWAATEQALGKPQDQVRTRDQVVVICDRCRQPRSVSYNRAKQTTEHRCMSCVKRQGDHSTGDQVEYRCSHPECDVVQLQQYRVGKQQGWLCHHHAMKQLFADGTHAEYLRQPRSTPMSQQQRDKIGRAASTNWQRESYRANWSQSMSRSKQHRSTLSKAIWSDPVRLAKLSQSIRALWSTTEYRTVKTQQSQQLWEQQWYRELQAQGMADPEVRAQISQAAYRLWQERRDELTAIIRENLQDPDTLAKLSAASKAAWEREDYRAGQQAKNERVFADPAVIQQIAEKSRAAWQDSEYRERAIAAIHVTWECPERRAVMAAKSKAVWQDPDYRAKMAVIRASQPCISSIQTMLYHYLDDLGVTYHPENENTTIGHYVFDCLVPGGQGRKHLLIECQGDYWHSLPKAAQNDRAKFTYIDRYFPDHEIMYLWEHEFGTAGRVLDRLKQKLGIQLDTVEFQLADVQLREPTGAELKSFLDAYHYIGKDRGGQTLGAYLGQELIGCVVYSPPLRQNTAGQFGMSDSEVRELSRLCIHPAYHQKNFASWLISRSLRRLADTRLVVAYADRTVGHTGAVYRASGFQLHHEVPPDYWYVDQEGFVMHKRTLYGRARQFGLVEAEYAQRFGYLKQWGGQKLCFVRALG